MRSKTLIIGPSWVGDMVMAQSLFLRLKEESPNIYLAVLAPAWSEALLSRMPEVDETIVLPVGHKQLRIGVRWRLARKIKQANFDHAIVLPGSFKSALIPFFARIKKRSGFIGEQRYGLLNDIRKLDKKALPLNVERFLALGSSEHKLPNTIPKPNLQLDQAAQNAVREKFDIESNKPILALCPGAEFGPAKQWPAEHYAHVASASLAMGWQIMLLGSPADKNYCVQINQLAGQQCNDISGKTSLLEVMDVLSISDFVVSNDSGLMHVAAAYHRPLAAIYGSSSASFTPPLSDNNTQISLALDCQPCFKRECPLGHTDCLKNLTPDRVVSLIAPLH